MNKPGLGALVVGQGPRPVIEAEVMALAGGSVDLEPSRRAGRILAGQD